MRILQLNTSLNSFVPMPKFLLANLTCSGIFYCVLQCIEGCYIAGFRSYFPVNTRRSPNVGPASLTMDQHLPTLGERLVFAGFQLTCVGCYTVIYHTYIIICHLVCSADLWIRFSIVTSSLSKPALLWIYFKNRLSRVIVPVLSCRSPAFEMTIKHVQFSRVLWS